MEKYVIIVFIVLFVILLLFAFNFGKIIGKRIMYELMKEVIKKEREDAIKKSRSTLVGNFSEQISPLLPNFPLKPSEVKFIGKPVDFVGFKGIDSGEIEEIVFIEVKSGKSK